MSKAVLPPKLSTFGHVRGIHRDGLDSISSETDGPAADCLTRKHRTTPIIPNPPPVDEEELQMQDSFPRNAQIGVGAIELTWNSGVRSSLIRG